MRKTILKMTHFKIGLRTAINILRFIFKMKCFSLAFFCSETKKHRFTICTHLLPLNEFHIHIIIIIVVRFNNLNTGKMIIQHTSPHTHTHQTLAPFDIRT